MPANRGSTSKFVAIKEATYGTTPATPVMIELPLVSFTPNSSTTVMTSAQLRSHPFVDKLSKGNFVHEISMAWELQDANHDMLLETVFGGAITAKALKFADVLKGITFEEQVGGGSSLFNQFSGLYLNRLEITASAGDTTPVAVTASGNARVGTLDAAATLATSVTAAANNDPFVFQDASLTLSGDEIPVTSGNIVFERTVDPLNIWNLRTPREYVPSNVACSGSITIPYDDDSISSVVAGFTDAPLLFSFGNVGGTTFRKFAVPKTKFISLGRPVDGRGVRLQTVNWQAIYDSSSQTVATMTTQ